jgi:hypothetical protein
MSQQVEMLGVVAGCKAARLRNKVAAPTTVAGKLQMYFFSHK